jgi:hypothetical protein
MKIWGLVFVAGLVLANGACAPDSLTAAVPAPAPTSIGSGVGRAVARPLFVVDGRVVEEGNAGEISPARVLELRVLQGEPAVQAYGVQAANGVVIITTRHPGDGLAGRTRAGGCGGRALAVAAAHAVPPPGPPAPIRLISFSTLRADDPPLFVVDGRLLDRNRCEHVDAGEIVQVRVEEGAEMTALYGARAAKGVVFITTRHAGARR